MCSVVHAVGVDRGAKDRRQVISTETDVETELIGRGKQSVEVTIEKAELPMVQPESFPDAVTDEERRIEH